MRKSGLVALFLAFLLPSLYSAQLYAEELEYKEYTVKKGDTLWDITGGELKDSFQWPLVWKENPKVKNPDRIYPGQIILIPIGRKEQKVEELPVPPSETAVPKAAEPVVAKPTVPEPKTIKPIKKDYIVQRGVLLYAGYITNSVPYVGEISGSPTGRKHFGHTDEVYLKTTEPASKGDKFYVIRKGAGVFHPTEKKLFLGWVVEIVGEVEVVKVDRDGILARVSSAFTELSVGDALDRHYDIELPYVLEKPRKPEVTGYVVATKDMRTLSGQTDIIYIDKGSRDGLVPGDVLMTIAPGTEERQSALIQVILTREQTATALVLKGTDAVNRGDKFSGAK